MEHRSNIELYYSTEINETDKLISLAGDEFNHAFKVMRHNNDDFIFVTDGKGKIFKGKISKILNDHIQIEIVEIKKFQNKFDNIYFCIPVLKNPDRLKFAIEKSVELGITNFVLTQSKRTVAKKVNLERLHKIALAAMKQSLRAYLPGLEEQVLSEIKNESAVKIILEQNSTERFKFKNSEDKEYYFLFGPEGGFDESEINQLKPDKIFSLGTNRLRSETAIVKCASLINYFDG